MTDRSLQGEFEPDDLTAFLGVLTQNIAAVNQASCTDSESPPLPALTLTSQQLILPILTLVGIGRRSQKWGSSIGSALKCRFGVADRSHLILDLHTFSLLTT